MTDLLVLLWLAVLSVEQTAWCLVYALRSPWRETSLGPVWLLKGSALALTWVTFLYDVLVADVPDWVWAWFNGPLLVAGTTWWLVVTLRVQSSDRTDEPAETT